MKLNAYRFLIFIAFLSQVYGNSLRESEPHIGMDEVEMRRLFGNSIVSETPSGGVFLKILFYGHNADVFLGMRSGKVGYISATFAKGGVHTAPIKIFREIRLCLEDLAGKSFSYVRIGNVYAIGDGGGLVRDPRKMNALVFGTGVNGVVYQVEISGARMTELADSGEVELVITSEESIRAPKGG